MKILKGIVSDNSSTSSSRVINIGGFITGTILLLYHGLWLDSLNYDVLAVYLTYCSATYVGGKYVGRKYGDSNDGGNNDTDTNEDYNRRQASDNRNAERSSDSYDIR